MADESSGRGGSSRSHPDCPRCGEPVATLTVIGPEDGYVGPCGCHMPPELLPNPGLGE
ncbi:MULTISPECIES: hypothetical protein [unclassified Natrinema]|uniref:hypothetical protein n=1 Tax=unclassified Natrinema TaxID=2622230 RepID=UPI00159BC1CB|nr:hypothetical protein [Natrinema sp. CBA1119]